MEEWGVLVQERLLLMPCSGSLLVKMSIRGRGLLSTGMIQGLGFLCPGTTKRDRKNISGSKAEAEDFWSNLGAMMLISREF